MPLLVDGVIAFTLIEAAVLVLYHRRTGRGIAPRALLPAVAAGLLLMLALRCGVHEAGTAWVALCLLGAGAAHVGDLWLRWRAAPMRSRATLGGRTTA